MAIPSGSGTEVIKVFKATGVDDSPVVDIITGEADHIYTIISVIFCMAGAGSSTFTLRTVNAAASVAYYWLNQQPLVQSDTFVFDTKFGLSGNDRLQVYSTSGADIQVLCTYIDQNWE